ncbi:MAG: carboxypeptidase regulatory-like domain-containing protein [Terriglobales bacterium]
MLTLTVSALAQVENAEPAQIPPGPYLISGTVVNAKGTNPLSRCRVTIASVKNRLSMQAMITDDDGRFEFHVPAGKYSLTGAKRGFITAAYNQHEQFSTAIAAGADLDSQNLVLRLAPNAVLTGKVLDEVGDPVRHAQITVYRDDHSQGVGRIVGSGGAVTDDQGHYEWTPLDEGTYFVAAKASPWYAVHPTLHDESSTSAPAQVDSSLDVAYPITYYGDATEAADAVPIPVRGGDRLEADIHLNPLPSLHLIVHVPDDTTHGFNLPTLQKPAFDGVEQVESTTIRNVAPGLYELSGVAAGRYTVRMPDSTGRVRESSDVDLNSGGELDLSAANLTGKIKATVKVEGAAELPAQLQIGLRNNKGRVESTPLDARGEANFTDVIPGRYEVVVSSQAQRYSVVRIASEAGAISGHTLTVPAGASLSISLSLLAGSVSVEGFVRHAGKAAAGVMVVLVPKNPEDNRDRFRRDQSDSDGSFTLAEVFSGSYTVVAIENGWDLDWAEPAVLAGYLKHGQAIEIPSQSQTTVRLPEAVEVQGR